MALVILEGVDCSGKSTLAAALAAALEKDNGLPTRVMHASAPKNHPLVEYELSLERYRPWRENIVIDRWHWGEMIWPDYFNRDSKYTPEMFYHTELFLQSRGAVMVHCTGAPAKIIERMRTRGEKLLVEDAVGPVIEKFNTVHRSSILPRIRHSIEEPVSTHEVIDMARDGATFADHALSVTPELVGSSIEWPELMLVGDRGALPRAGRPPHELPFVPYADTSGAYLMKAIESIPSFMLTNAFISVYERSPSSRVYGRQRLRALWNTLGRPKVVALGAAAHMVLNDEAVKHGVVPHPQFVRRFHHKSREKYTTAILQAAAKREDLRHWFPQSLTT